MTTKTVWKYELKLIERQALMVPTIFEPLRLGKQGENICLWSLVILEDPQWKIGILCIGTGRPVPMNAKYIGSISDGPFEWHFWQESRSIRQGGT